jgi:hypothetical protein
MSLEFNPENRNYVSTRCCSFCRRAGHNITRCDSQPIRMFERETLNFIQLLNLRSELRVQDISNTENLRRYLLGEALNDSALVRAFAIRLCGASTRSNLDTCIELTIEYFMPRIQYGETNNQNIQENQPAARPNSRRGRRFGFSELSVPYYEMGERTTIETESILYAMMFIEMIRLINTSSETEIDRKFCIKTKISENQDDLEEKCECNICYDMHEKQKFIKLDCGHEFCKDCIKQSLQNETRETPCCAFCRADIKFLELRLESIKNEFDNLITSEHQT